MKNLYLILAAFIVSFSVMAQDMNRLILTEQTGAYKAYSIEDVRDVTFANVTGEIYADVEIHEVALDKLVISISMSDECVGFKISCIPTVVASQYDDKGLAKYIDSIEPNAYYQNFTRGELSGISLSEGSEYTIATVGIDQYGVLCDVYRAEFTTPGAQVQGNPVVEAEVIDEQYFEFTVRFTPNADVSEYYVVAGEEGTLQAQYEQFAAFMGFTNFGDMIKAWGAPLNAADSYTWKEMTPGTTYDVYILPLDMEGNYGEYTNIQATTLSLGGPGTAEVTVTMGDYKLNDWYGEMLPSQFVTYTPNDQASAYRFSVYLASEYDAGKDALIAELMSEPPMPMANWFFYETIVTDYQLNPNTSVVVIAAAKNINGEWGPLTEVRYTTPAQVTSAPAMKGESVRINKYNVPSFVPGKLPVINKSAGAAKLSK